MSIKSFIFLCSFCFVSVAQACGPWFPEPYVLKSDWAIYAGPTVGFEREIRHLKPEATLGAAQYSDEWAGGERSVEELRMALSRSDVPAEKHEAVVAAYQVFRGTLNDIKLYLDTPVYARYHPKADEEERLAKVKELQTLVVPEILPDEFRYYLEGALAYYKTDTAAAALAWGKLLELPAEQRSFRSVTAHFMLGKICDNPDHDHFRQVRLLAQEGYADSLGLAAASYGREGRLMMDHHRYLQSIHLYLEQWGAGYGNAVQSLKRVAAEAWRYVDERGLAVLVNDEKARGVLTAYLLTEYSGANTGVLRKRLIEALPASQELSMAEAGRFALLEYEENNVSAARLWLDYASSDDALALWVRSKLLLRSGKIDAGRVLLLSLAEQMSAGPDWNRLDTRVAWGELGVLQLREQRYADAATAFYNARSWQDCAYVLDCLLTTEELLTWVDEFKRIEDYDLGDPRALLARRLMREARFNEALRYFDAAASVHAEAYIKHMQYASNAAHEDVERARAYWRVARLLNDHGMQLLGSELDPDFAWLEGRYTWGNVKAERKAQQYLEDYRLNAVAEAEMNRARETEVKPYVRYHYRYRAIGLAELAAGLLPNNDENAARIYCVAGAWVKLRDPYTADRLFKALAVRCPKTELGRAANEINWFPQVDLSELEPFM